MTDHEAIEQLAALLDGDGAADETSSLGALAGLATAVRDHADVVAPTAEFRSSLRAELVAAADAPPGLVERMRDAWTTRTAHLRTSARVAVATMTASGMIGSAGVAVAAQEAMPGDLLHGLKSLTEDARLMLAVDGVPEARLHLAFARERLEELRATASQLDADEIVALLAEMDAHSEAGAEALLDGAAFGAADTDEVRRFTADQRHGLVSVLNRLPLLAQPMAEDSLELLRRIEATVDGASQGSDSDRRTERSAPDDDGGLLHDLQQGAEREPPRDLRLPPADLPDGDAQVPSLGDNPVLPLEDHADTDTPTSSSTDDDHDTAQDGPEQPEPDQDQEPEPEPFEPTGELVDPEVDNDDEGEEGRGLDSPSSVEQLPVEDAAEVVEDATGADVSTGPAERLQDGTEDLLDE